MRQKGSEAENWHLLSAAYRRRRIRADLEHRGVSPAASAPVAERLEARSPEPGSAAYGAALDGALAVYAVHRGERAALEHSASDIEEIQRLMHGFAGELRKLEEGLRIVSAYVLRMHSKATQERGGILH